jgi:hypothetical protein
MNIHPGDAEVEKNAGLLFRGVRRRFGAGV